MLGERQLCDGFWRGIYRTQLGKAKSGKFGPYRECTMPLFALTPCFVVLISGALQPVGGRGEDPPRNNICYAFAERA